MSLISSVNTVIRLGPGRPGNGVWIPDNRETFFTTAALEHTETNAQIYRMLQRPDKAVGA